MNFSFLVVAVIATFFCCVTSIHINCTAVGLVDTACGYYIIKTINEFINQDESYSRELPPVLSALDLPINVNASMGLNHIPSVDMLAGTVQVSIQKICVYRYFIYILFFSRLHLYST